MGQELNPREPARADGVGGPAYLLEALGICKDFGALRANDHVDLRVAPGEIHALLGENGAGKSTLVKIIYGSLQPSAGELRWQGRPVTIASPAAARRLGIGMVFQHFSLFEALTVAENIALALSGTLDLAALSARIARVSVDYGLPLEPSATVADLSVGERQRIEIVRCLLQEPRLLIMDEPTAVLTPQEADQLFLTLQRLAGEGCAVLYISHRLEEVKRLCDNATILRHGKVVDRVDPQKETAACLARLMVGADIHTVKAGADKLGGLPRLRLDGLSQAADEPVRRGAPQSPPGCARWRDGLHRRRRRQRPGRTVRCASPANGAAAMPRRCRSMARLAAISADRTAPAWRRLRAGGAPGSRHRPALDAVGKCRPDRSFCG